MKNERQEKLARSYVRNGVWGWTLEAQDAALLGADGFDAGQCYRDELTAARAKKPSHVQPDWLIERAAMLKPTRRRGGEVILVATVLALAVSESDLVAALAAAEARQATVIALDSGLKFKPGGGAAGIKVALDDWQRAKREAQTRPGRARGNQVAAEARRRRTLEKLPKARPLWRNTRPDRITAEQVSAEVGLSIRTLYAELGRRPDIKKGRSSNMSEPATTKTTIHIPCRGCGRPLSWLNARWTCLRCDA